MCKITSAFSTFSPHLQYSRFTMICYACLKLRMLVCLSAQKYSSLKIFYTDKRKNSKWYHHKIWCFFTNFITPEYSQKCYKSHLPFQICSGSDTPGTPLHDVTHDWYMNNGPTSVKDARAGFTTQFAPEFIKDVYFVTLQFIKEVHFVTLQFIKEVHFVTLQFIKEVHL